MCPMMRIVTNNYRSRAVFLLQRIVLIVLLIAVNECIRTPCLHQCEQKLLILFSEGKDAMQYEKATRLPHYFLNIFTQTMSAKIYNR